MNPHTWIVRGCAMALLMLVSAAAGDAAGTIHRTAYLTFRQPVGLPGIALAAGTYRFELAAPGGSPSTSSSFRFSCRRSALTEATSARDGLITRKP